MGRYPSFVVPGVIIGAFLFLPAIVSADPVPPTFGPVMTAPFNQSITYMGSRWEDQVHFYYDSTTLPVGTSLYQYGKGQHDELCTGVKGKETSDEPCNLLASVDGWRYVIYPESNLCCKFCNVSDYCGIISPNWLKNGSNYVGKEVIDGYSCEGWEKTGGEENYFYVTTDEQQIPCQYWEGYPTPDIGKNFWNFTLPLFNRNPINSSTFEIPSGMGCENMCDKTTMSYSERIIKFFANQIAQT